jgi:hypothetical protein
MSTRKAGHTNVGIGERVAQLILLGEDGGTMLLVVGVLRDAVRAA